MHPQTLDLKFSSLILWEKEGLVTPSERCDPMVTFCHRVQTRRALSKMKRTVHVVYNPSTF